MPIISGSTGAASPSGGTGFTTVALKPADTSRNTTAVLAADPDLAFTIGASATEIWSFEIFVMVNAANSTMDGQFGLTGPAAATAFWGFHDNATTLAGWNPLGTGGVPGNTLTMATSSAFGTGASSAITTLIYLAGWAFGGGTGGSVALTWAQNTSDAGALILRKGSFLRASKLIA